MALVSFFLCKTLCYLLDIIFFYSCVWYMRQLFCFMPLSYAMLLFLHDSYVFLLLYVLCQPYVFIIVYSYNVLYAW
jgi:hypothetical protein